MKKIIAASLLGLALCSQAFAQGQCLQTVTKNSSGTVIPGNDTIAYGPFFVSCGGGRVTVSMSSSVNMNLRLVSGGTTVGQSQWGYLTALVNPGAYEVIVDAGQNSGQTPIPWSISVSQPTN